MLSLEAASPLVEAEESPEVDVQPASRPASRAAHTSRERIRLRVIEDLLLSVPGGRPGKSLGYSSSILCRRAVVNWRVQDDFQPSCTNCTNFDLIFLPFGQD